MSPLLAALAGAAVRGGALVAVALVASQALRRSSAALRHSVVLAGILAQLLVPFVPRVVPQVRLPYPASDGAVVERTLTGASATATPVEPPGAGWDVDARLLGADPVSGPVDFAWLLGLVWAAVASGILGRYLVGVAGAARLRAGARSPTTAELPPRLVAGAARAAGLSRPPEVRFADLATPIACGLVRRAVLLPPAAADWSAARLRMVLVHEMAHLRRRDVATQGLAQVACAIFWFDPLLWWARARLRAAAESAADDSVLSDGTPPDRYVMELVRLVRESLPARVPLAAASVARGLSERAHRALDPRLERGAARRRPLLAGLGLMFAATLLLGAATPTPRSRADGGLIDGIASGCAWQTDGRHVNRWTEEDGRPRWQVLWEGEDCAVEFLAEPGASLAAGILAPVTGGRVSVRVRRGAAVDSAVLLRDERGALRTTASPDLARGAPLAAWLRAFADEVALHTAFDAVPRVDELLEAGGVAAVIARADAARGDHAAGVYLAALVARRGLTDDERVEALRVAVRRVLNDAVMTDLLLALGARRPIGAGGPVREAFDDAAATLRSRAAREAIHAVD